MTIVVLRKGLRMIIENPANEPHYLSRYWPIKPKIVDTNRRESGDYQNKPTQFWFINCEPSYNFIFEPLIIQPKRRHQDLNSKAIRSEMSPEYANRFIREFIL